MRETRNICRVNGTQITSINCNTVFIVNNLVSDTTNLDPCKNDWNILDNGGSWRSWFFWWYHSCYSIKIVWESRISSSIDSFNSEIILSMWCEVLERKHIASWVLNPGINTWFFVLTHIFSSTKFSPIKSQWSLRDYN